MQIIHSATGAVINGLNASEDVAVTVAPHETATGGTSEPVSIHEFNATRAIGASVNQGFTVNASSPTHRQDKLSLSVAPGSEAVCSVSGWNVSRNTQDGTARVIVTDPSGARVVEYPVALVGGGTAYIGPVSYAAGSLMKHLNDRALALCAANTPPATFADASALMRQSVDYNGNPVSTAINPSNWIKQSAPGWSAWTDEQIAQVFGGVIGGVQIATGWVHQNYRILPGGANHNASCSAESIANGTCYNLTGDSRLVYDTSNPAGKRYFNVMPDGFESKLRAIVNPTYRQGGIILFEPWVGLPRLTVFARLTNHQVGGVYGTYLIVPLDVTWNTDNGSMCAVPADPTVAPFCTNYYDGSIFKGGDSFSPIAVKINDTVVYLGSVSNAGGGATPFVDAGRINAAMASMCAKRGVAADAVPAERIVDLSAFNTYP